MTKHFWVTKAVCCALAIALCAVGCAPEISPTTPQAPADSYAVDPALVPPMTAAGLELFRRVVASAGEANVFFSPWSLETALCMTYNGAAGETQGAMANAMHLDGLSLQRVNEGGAGLQRSLLSPDTGVNLRLANSLWARQGVPFRDDFLERNRRYYGAEVVALDFGARGASQRINRWVQESTGGKIDKIVSDVIDPLTVLFLINAVYLEAGWQKPFSPSDTQKQPFHTSDGGAVQAPMMSVRWSFPYYRGEGLQAVQLPYGNGRMSMVILLPDAESSLDALLAALDAAHWERWMAAMQTAAGRVSLPRFRTETTAMLNDALSAQGMAVAFDKDRADFSGMRPIPPRLYISEVKQKAFVEVDEKGTVAAAATVVEVAVAAALEDSFTFVADRPFLYAIVDGQTGVVLFMGVLRKP
jgi:serine protease inhibitor